MPPLNTDKIKKVAPNTGWQLNASGIADASVTNFTLVSATNLPVDTAVILTIDRVDASGEKTPGKMERVVGIVSGSNVISVIRGVGGTAQAHAGGAVVEIVIDAVIWNDVMTHILVEHNQDGSHKITSLDTIRYAPDSGGSDAYAITLVPALSSYYNGLRVHFKANTINTGAASLNINGLGAITIKKNKDQDLADGDIKAGQIVALVYNATTGFFEMTSQLGNAGLSYSGFQPPEGYTWNIKIVPTVASNSLTLSVKGKDGNDLSASNVGYVMLGGAWRSITSALSLTVAQGTSNPFNRGGTDFTGKEVDYFAHFLLDGSTVRLAMATIALGGKYGLYNSTLTSEKYMALSGGTPAASSPICVIGRFAATVTFSTPNYNWTVPTYDDDNLRQGNIIESRDLTFTSTLVGFSGTPTQNCGYKLIGNRVFIDLFISGTSNSASFTATLPFSISMPFTSSQVLVCWVQDNGTASSGRSVISDGASSITFGKVVTADAGFTSSGGKGAYLHINTSV